MHQDTNCFLAPMYIPKDAAPIMVCVWDPWLAPKITSRRAKNYSNQPGQHQS